MTQRDEQIRGARRIVRTALAVVVLAACGKPHVSLPDVWQPAGQLPADYQMEVTRGVILARIDVVTDGHPGFGPITNPLVLQFQPAGSDDTVLDPLGPNARVWTTPSERPSQWRHDTPGLLALSVAAATYTGALIAYPDPSHDSATPSSIPEPSANLAFAPVEIPPGAIVYIGDIEIRQTISGWDRLLDRVEVAYAARDNFAATVADFRGRYPQLAEVPVERRVVAVRPAS